MTILLTVVSQVCFAQLGSFGAPVGKDQLALAEQNSNRIALLLNVANQISSRGVDPCTNNFLNTPQAIKFFVEGYSKMLDYQGKRRFDDEKLTTALVAFQKCHKQ